MDPNGAIAAEPAVADAPSRTRAYRLLWVALAILAALVIVGGVIAVLEKHAPPRAARLLPESDAIVYLNLAAVREATHFDRNPVAPAEDYQQFISSSGIAFERDLDQAAFAVHQLANPLTSQGPFAYSEVFVGRFDTARFTSYLQSQATSREMYAGHTIYSVLHDGRTVRVAILDKRTVAVSNTPEPEQIHEIVDRTRDFYPSGPAILQDHYRDVPLLSFAWGLGKIAAPLTGDGDLHLFGFRVPLPTNTVFIASARYLEALHLRVDEFAPNETVAAASATMARTVIGFYQGEQKLRTAVGGQPDEDMAKLLHSIQVKQDKDRATLTATVPTNLLKRLASQ